MNLGHLAAIALAAASHAAETPIDEIDGQDLRPGLAALYRAGLTELSRVDIKPIVAAGRGSVHPRLPAGPFEVTWTGLLHTQGNDSYTFAAAVGGRLTITVDGSVVLEGTGSTDRAVIAGDKPIALAGGLHRIRIHYRSTVETPARLQVRWRGGAFPDEPLPSWRLKHLPMELADGFARDALAERGRLDAARLGCARCHSSAFGSPDDPPPGPSLADAGSRIARPWLLKWLADPHAVNGGARMPALFAGDRLGAVERALVADQLLGRSVKPVDAVQGDHRRGKRDFLGFGCAACHLVPDLKPSDQPGLQRSALTGLGDRFTHESLAAFLGNPTSRYPDSRHPRIPLERETALDMAAYLLLWAPATTANAEPAPTPAEIDQVAKRLGARGAAAAGKALLRDKGCVSCHTGLGDAIPTDRPVAIKDDARGCLSGKTLPRYTLDADTTAALSAHRVVAASEVHAAPVEQRRRMLDRFGCFRCHSAEPDRRPPIEEVGAAMGGAYLQYLPYLKTPRLNHALDKYTRQYVYSTIREGVSGVRHARFSYRMPAFGPHADAIVQALAEADGELAAPDAPAAATVDDPTLHTFGNTLVGSGGYSCISCHIWAGKQLNEPDPGAIGPEMTSITRRIRRDWFDRWIDEPNRIHPGTVMPQIFFRDKPATIRNVLDGDPRRQKDAIWAYLSLGLSAPSPRPPSPIPVAGPPAGSAPFASPVPVFLPDNSPVDALCVITADHDILIYDVSSMRLRAAYTSARLLRNIRGRRRWFTVEGTLVPGSDLSPAAAKGVEYLGCERLSDGVRIRLRSGSAEHEHTFRWQGRRIVETRGPVNAGKQFAAFDLPAAKAPEPIPFPPATDSGGDEGSLVRPGYRAVAFPRPKTPAGDDLVMPSAIAVNPRDGRVFVASMKLGEIFVLRDGEGDGRNARWENYGGGLFQEAYSMHAEADGLFVLHRRNLTKLSDSGASANRADRVFALPHSVVDAYDYAYGLVREDDGAFVFSYAPYASREMPGSGGAVRMRPGSTGVEEVAYGFRNPLGWTRDTKGGIFYTDNQGEWVAANKLCHIVPGRFYGFPNSAQRDHANKPFGKTAVWVPYAWARSINGVTCDTTAGKFGPFAGQLFLAELMYGGAIIRASVEEVNGQAQGACFPFWGRGLLGPVVMAFDPKGRLFVGSITEPGWMAQPDRGAVFRIDFTGEVPFEIKTINVRPQGFRLVFTAPVDRKLAADPASYELEHYRYEYTGAYGSPELDRTKAAVRAVEVSPDGLSVELTTVPLVTDRVYLVGAPGVRGADGRKLVHPTGAYTLNEIPKGK